MISGSVRRAPPVSNRTDIDMVEEQPTLDFRNSYSRVAAQNSIDKPTVGFDHVDPLDPRFFDGQFGTGATAKLQIMPATRQFHLQKGNFTCRHGRVIHFVSY